MMRRRHQGRAGAVNGMTAGGSGLYAFGYGSSGEAMLGPTARPRRRCLWHREIPDAIVAASPACGLVRRATDNGEEPAHEFDHSRAR